MKRRDFLKKSALSTAAVVSFSTFLESITYSIVNKSIAAGSSDYKKKYIFIQEPMAPPRWFFDCPLHPFGDTANFVPNTGVATRYTGSSRYDGSVYGTSKVQGIDMPWMWRFDIPTPNGAWEPLANLAEGMFIIRGCSNNNSAHSAAQLLHFKPLGIDTSLNALTADKSNLPIAAISLDTEHYSFASDRGQTSSAISGDGNYIKAILEPFNLTPAVKQFRLDQKNQGKYQDSLSSLNDVAHRSQPKSKLVTLANENAVKIFERDFGDLESAYTTLFNKYKDLITRAISPDRRLEGISDKYVGTNSTRNFLYKENQGQGITGDVREMIDQWTNADSMAQQFATTEFIITNNLSSSITMSIKGLSDISYNGAPRGQSFDEHNCGIMVSIMLNTYYYLALSTCIYELTNQLKSNNMYEDTVIDLAGDFGRKSRPDGSGSDHAPEATSNTFFSGSIKGLNVVGDIKNGSGEYPGTWGAQASNSGYGLFTVGHMASTLASLLEVESPVTSAPSLVKLENGKFVSKLPTGKITS